MIEKKIHVSWRNKDVMKKDYVLVKYGILPLKLLNPDYEFTIYDDNDVEDYLKSNLSQEDYDLIRPKSIVEKVDLWRLLIIYNEGGVYMDIDRLCNVPLSEVIKEKTTCILPMFYDTDFSQDIMISCSHNIFHKRAIELNLERRRTQTVASIMDLGPETYMNAVTEVLLGKRLSRNCGAEYVRQLREIIEKTPYLETYRERPVTDTLLYRGHFPHDYAMAKKEMYSNESVTHWHFYNK